MSDATVPMSTSIAMSEYERFVLAMFFGGTYKPKNKAARKAMKLVYKRLRLDEIAGRLRTAEGIKPSALKNTPDVIPINEETVNWVKANLNDVESQTLDSITLSELEDRFDEVAAGTYKLPADVKPLLTAVPMPPPAAPETPSAPDAS